MPSQKYFAYNFQILCASLHRKCLHQVRSLALSFYGWCHYKAHLKDNFRSLNYLPCLVTYKVYYLLLSNSNLDLHLQQIGQWRAVKKSRKTQNCFCLLNRLRRSNFVGQKCWSFWQKCHNTKLILFHLLNHVRKSNLLKFSTHIMSK